MAEKLLFAVLFIVLVASLITSCTAVNAVRNDASKLLATSTTSGTSPKTTKAIIYSHTGYIEKEITFENSVYYFQDGTNQPTIPSSPNIPLQDISSLTMTYQYSSPETQVQVEVDAVLVSPENWQKAVTLVPQETEKGDFSISFPIDLNSLKTTT